MKYIAALFILLLSGLASAEAIISVEHWLNKENPISITVEPSAHDSGWSYTIRAKLAFEDQAFSVFNIQLNGNTNMYLQHSKEGEYAEAGFHSCGDSLKDFTVLAFYEDEHSEVIVKVNKHSSCK